LLTISKVGSGIVLVEHGVCVAHLIQGAKLNEPWFVAMHLYQEMNGAGMNGAEKVSSVVTARLPSGAAVRVEVAGSGAGDGMTSVGLRDLDLDRALDAVGEIGSAVVEKLRAAKPTRATAELKLGFAVEAGKLTALWVGGKGEASLTVTLEWAERPGEPGAAGGGG
jgi:Trypsin-co-occurring domain 1